MRLLSLSEVSIQPRTSLRKFIKAKKNLYTVFKTVEVTVAGTHNSFATVEEGFGAANHRGGFQLVQGGWPFSVSWQSSAVARRRREPCEESSKTGFS